MSSRPPAIRLEVCDHCRARQPTPDEIRRGAVIRSHVLRLDCPHYWEHVACDQADDIRSHSERIRELIRERNDEQSKAEAAYDAAEQYARRAGVDITRHSVLKYVEQYWEQRGKFEKRWQDLETLRWDMWQLVQRLEDALPVADDLDPRTVVERVIRALRSHPHMGGDRKKWTPDLFGRPATPQAGQAGLFDATEVA